MSNLSRPLNSPSATTIDDFRDFTLANAVPLGGAGTPQFFEGTALVKASAAVLAEAKPTATV